MDMDQNALLYYQSARALKFYSAKLEYISGFVIKLSKNLFFFRGGDTPFNCGSSIGIANNKYCMNKILEHSGFPVPRATIISKDSFISKNLDLLIKNLNFPLVIKPTSGTVGGLDVLCNIGDIMELKTYLEEKFQKYPFLSVEEFHPNLNAYRVLVFYNKVIGVIQRIPARIVGDGILSIKELIAINNTHREKIQATYLLGLIEVDAEVNIRLKELNMTLDTIPRENETVTLCYTCNDLRGGTVESLGKRICKENARLLCKAANALNLNLVGFDVLSEDILIPFSESRGVIIEANHHPDITFHENPMSGPPVRVSKIMLRRLIWKHPVAYVMGLYQGNNHRFYFRFSLLILVVIAYKLLVI